MEVKLVRTKKINKQAGRRKEKNEKNKKQDEDRRLPKQEKRP